MLKHCTFCFDAGPASTIFANIKPTLVHRLVFTGQRIPIGIERPGTSGTYPTAVATSPDPVGEGGAKSHRGLPFNRRCRIYSFFSFFISTLSTTF